MRDMNQGAHITRGDLAIKRPGTGIPPCALDQVIGRALRSGMRADDVLRWDDLH